MSHSTRTLAAGAALVLAALLAAGCGGKKPQPETGQDQPSPHSMTTPDYPKPDDEGRIHIGPLGGALPTGWKSVPPASPMRRAQFELPSPEGETEPGTIAAFYFGPQAGDVEANLNRWYDQFEQPDGRPTKEVAVRESFDVGPLKVTMVHFTGTLLSSSMPGAPSMEKREKWMNLSAIIESPAGPWFFKGTGPEATMEANREAFRGFLESLTFESPVDGQPAHAEMGG